MGKQNQNKQATKNYYISVDILIFWGRKRGYNYDLGLRRWRINKDLGVHKYQKVEKC
jgi:hypothetical protein